MVKKCCSVSRPCQSGMSVFSLGPGAVVGSFELSCGNLAGATRSTAWGLTWQVRHVHSCGLLLRLLQRSRPPDWVLTQAAHPGWLPRRNPKPRQVIWVLGLQPCCIRCIQPLAHLNILLYKESASQCLQDGAGKKKEAAAVPDIDGISIDELNQKIATLEKEKAKEEEYRNYMQLERVRNTGRAGLELLLRRASGCLETPIGSMLSEQQLPGTAASVMQGAGPFA